MRKESKSIGQSAAVPAFANTLMPFLLILLASCWTISAQNLTPKPGDPYFAPFAPVEAPKPQKHFLKEGDRLAICGDSITEQRMYSRIMETYLTVCQPELNISVRQYGWSGEKASGFLHRMTNDCLRFEPTVATTCYGMNDHEYRAYEDRIGNTYRSNSLAIIESFKAHGVRVILGSPGCVGKTPTWVGDKNASVLDLNLNLCKLRNIDIELADAEKVGFADVFWPMLTDGHAAQERYGASYAIAGKDGVHPAWAGHVVMAYAFLHAFGLDGQIGTLTVDLRSKTAKVSKGHDLLGFDGSELRVASHRYPFCAGNGDPSRDDNMRSGMTLVPFDEELNRFMLVVKHANAKSYAVTWGDQTRNFSGEDLTKGINLAKEFPQNPFCDAFGQVDQAVAHKQEFETKQVKDKFHGPDGKADMDGTVARTEEQRAPLVAAIKSAFVPVTHTIKMVAQ
ncbi:MAG TPA: SGNH/GDSL hydrolase family protein [Verrucomicrobiae bacterium]|nr:SGNH/GDSL hydrolase family protein [Verrucomicrobiae bacterium]